MTARHVVDSLSSHKWPGDKIFVSFPDETLRNSVQVASLEIDDLMVVATCPKLDYAVIRLPSKVGLTKFSKWKARGWFQISNVSFNEIDGRSVSVLQWPSEGKAPRLPGTLATTVSWSTGRLLNYDYERSQGIHDAPTEQGSSGGVCLVGVNCRPLYIHCRTSDDRNFAVSIQSVVDHIRTNYDSLYDEIQSTADDRVLPKFTLENWPIINRHEILRRLVSVAEGEKSKPIYIAGPPSGGRTFVHELIKTVVSEGAHIKLDLASNLGSYQNVVSLLKSKSPALSEIDETFRQNEPIEAYFRRNLQNFLHTFQQYAEKTGTMYTIFFDNLNIAGDVVRDIVDLLSALAPRYSALTIFIAGSYEPPYNPRVDLVSLRAFDRTDYEIFLAEFRSFTRANISDDEFNTIIDTLFDGGNLLEANLYDQASALKILCTALEDAGSPQ